MNKQSHKEKGSVIKEVVCCCSEPQAEVLGTGPVPSDGTIHWHSRLYLDDRVPNLHFALLLAAGEAITSQGC